MRVAVTVCTRERPTLLRACLESLVSQRLPTGVSLLIVVVENDDFPRSADIVEELSRASGVAMFYAHEPRLGIPIARNRALSISLQHQPDWIAFIDDDETAAEGWLVNFVAVANSLRCDVLQGPVESLYPEAPPLWMKITARKHQPTGCALRTAATSNTFMRARVACPSGLGLRFNEKMRFTGGSDNDYFYRAAALGARICWSNETLVFESVPRVRLSLRWQLNRSMRVASNTIAMQKAQLGLLHSVFKCFPKYVGRLVRGLLVTLLAAPAALLLNTAGRRLMVSGLRDMASAIGALGAYVGFEPQPYRVVDRHPSMWKIASGAGGR